MNGATIFPNLTLSMTGAWGLQALRLDLVDDLGRASFGQVDFFVYFRHQ
jgi:hypothetical protein